MWNQSVIPKSNQPRNIYILKFCKTCRQGLFELSHSKYHSLSLSSFALTERREIILHLHKIMYEVWLPGDQTLQRKLFLQITVLTWGWNPWRSLFFFYFLLKLKLSFVTEGSQLVQSVSANKFKFFTEKPNVFYEHLPRALGPQNFFVITIWNWRLIKICRWYKKQPQIENDFFCYGKK